MAGATEEVLTFGVAVNKPGEFDPVFIEGVPSPEIRWVCDPVTGEPLLFGGRRTAEQWVRGEQLRSLREQGVLGGS